MCEVYSSLLNIVLVNKSYGDPDFCKDSVVHGLYSSSFAKCVFLLFTSLDCLSTASVTGPSSRSRLFLYEIKKTIPECDGHALYTTIIVIYEPLLLRSQFFLGDRRLQ